MFTMKQNLKIFFFACILCSFLPLCCQEFLVYNFDSDISDCYYFERWKLLHNISDDDADIKHKKINEVNSKYLGYGKEFYSKLTSGRKGVSKTIFETKDEKISGKNYVRYSKAWSCSDSQIPFTFEGNRIRCRIGKSPFFSRPFFVSKDFESLVSYFFSTTHDSLLIFKDNEWITLFSKSETNSCLENIFGKIYHLGSYSKKNFFDYVYSDIDEFLVISNLNGYLTFSLVWFNERWEILRIESSDNQFGVLRIP